MIESLVLSGVSFALGAFISPLILGKSKKLGLSLKTKEQLIIDKLNDPEIKKASVEFMKKLREEAGTIEGEQKMNLAVEFIIGLIVNTIPGKLDDLLLPPMIRKFAQGLYESYIK